MTPMTKTKLTHDDLTRSQRKALNALTANGLFEVHRLEPLYDDRPDDRHVWVVYGATRESAAITPRGRIIRSDVYAEGRP